MLSLKSQRVHRLGEMLALETQRILLPKEMLVLETQRVHRLGEMLALEI